MGDADWTRNSEKEVDTEPMEMVIVGEARMG